MKLLVYLFISCQFLFAGNEHNGGDTYPPEFGSAWFVGKEKVVILCYETSSDFGVEAKTIEDTIHAVYSTWQKYYEENRPVINPVEALAPSFNITLNSKCNGNEDLKFYLGTSDEAVEKAKLQYNSPIALAERTSYSLEKGWGKGLIWISGPKAIPKINWTVPHAFLGILLHELGHVFGCEHVEGTIMTENIAKLLYTGPMVTKIDGFRKLVFSFFDTFDYKGIIGSEENSTEYVETYRKFTGRDPVGKVQARVIYNIGQSKFIFSDDLGKTELKIKVEGKSESFKSSQKAFKAVAIIETKTGKALTEISSYAGEGMLQFGTVTTHGGVPVPVIFIRNSSSSNSPLDIRYFGTGLSLFKTVINQ